MSNYYHDHSPEEENGSFFPATSASLKCEQAHISSPPFETSSDSADHNDRTLKHDSQASLFSSSLNSSNDPRAEASHAPSRSGSPDDKSPSVLHLDFNDHSPSSEPNLTSWLSHSSHASSMDSGNLNHLTCTTSFGLPSPPPSPPLSQAFASPLQLSSDSQSHKSLPAESTAYTGKRKALCIGINYHGQEDELQSCVKDARHMRHLLVTRFHFEAENVTLLTDDPQHNDPCLKPTRSNILCAMRRLVEDAQPGDSLFLHYSGHGDQVNDTDGDEDDGQDETISPVDHEHSGLIVDDELHDILVKPLPRGCRLTAIYDSCHSGSVLDLPYLYTHQDEGGLVCSATEHPVLDESCQADVTCWSACKDDEIAADMKKGGAMSFAFLSALKHDRAHSYESLFTAVNNKIHVHQKPQLSTSHPIDLAHPFMI